MPAVRVVRPVVRSFKAAYAREAAAHVRAGGHALVWDAPSRVKLVFRIPRVRGEDLGLWSLLDLGAQRWTRVTKGPLRGLAMALVARDSLEIVRARALRDSVHPRSTRAIRLDCGTCAACCRDNEVILEPPDLARFVAARRPELGKPPYTRMKGDRVVLRLLRSHDCKHLLPDLRCAIYALRPNSCREFPPGSESCLYSREVELGLVDGAR
jgi:uncharacterized protein